MTVPGTVRPEPDAWLLTSASLIPARSIDLDSGVVYLLQGVGVAVLDLAVAPLLGDHVEQRAASQLVGLPHDAEVSGRDVADASLVDFEGARGRRVLGEGRRDFLADG